LLAAKPIKFGTDGWRGLIAADFTFERLVRVAPLAAKVLKDCFGDTTDGKTIIVGYDRRFLSEEFAQATAEAVQAAGFDVLLANTYAPTPAFSWAAKAHNALGSFVITASHNPGVYSGFKIKGAFGGSVSPEVTQRVEALLQEDPLPTTEPGSLALFDPWPSYCAELQSKVNVEALKEAIASGALTVFADVMHGAAATGLERLLGIPVHELNGDRDPLFGGGAPEPLPKYLPDLFRAIKTHAQSGASGLTVGLVFDGDSDRVAAVDGAGNFLSSQILIPILIEHLSTRRGFTGEIVKTISGSNLIPKVAALYGLDVYETPVGYKYIADRMLTTPVLLGGEESGGIGYGHHIPERDALLSALYVLEAVMQAGQDLSAQYQRLQEAAGFDAAYDRIDLPLANMEAQARVVHALKTETPTEIAGRKVVHCLDIDGYKFSFADGSWLLIRFSGTEPVLRLYSEAPTLAQVKENLNWANDWASRL
jgi:phosphomannomutase